MIHNETLSFIVTLLSVSHLSCSTEGVISDLPSSMLIVCEVFVFPID